MASLPSARGSSSHFRFGFRESVPDAEPHDLHDHDHQHGHGHGHGHTHGVVGRSYGRVPAYEPCS